jgi:DNA-binding response OmpR family regulator
MQRILVVDDDRLVADTIGLIFIKSGFNVRIAYSAAEALTFAREFHPELMLCDIDMPGRDGIELMSDMDHEQPGCRILVLTGFYSALARVRDRSRTLPRPISILTKPCQPADLLHAAGTLLRTA